MSVHFRPEVSMSGTNARRFVPPTILTELSHRDLTRHIALEGATVVSGGSFGDILRSKCNIKDRGEVPVAVKRLRFYLKEDIVMIFEKEIYAWSKLEHKNVLELLGFAFDDVSGYPLLISEWMENGSSWNYVKNNSDCDLMRLVTGAAEGLAYLHAKGVVHSDIKPDNIVITISGDACICDFGGSRIAAASKSIAKPSSGIHGTPRYLAFELIVVSDQSIKHTKESDVWAFGMTVFALLAKEQPYAYIRRDAQVLKAISDRQLPSFKFSTSRSKEEKSVLQNVCNLCWNHEPDRRAGMDFIVTNLKDFQQQNNMSRPRDYELDEPNAKRRRVMSVDDFAGSDTVIATHGIQNINLDASNGPTSSLLSHFAKLNRLVENKNALTEVYLYLNAAKAVFSFLLDISLNGKLDHLMCAVDKAFAFILRIYRAIETSDQIQTVSRLLQQSIECFLFIQQYASRSFEEQLCSSQKISEFIAFFDVFKEPRGRGSFGKPAFISSRVVQAINEFVLRKRLHPDESNKDEHQLCLNGTRVEVQKQIINWALSPSKQNIFWLHGVPGSGKSTIVATVAEVFRGIYRLGAFLSFKREKTDPSSVIPTIAFKLSLFDHAIGSRISDETIRDSGILSTPTSTQFDKLLLAPLCAAASAQQGPVVIVLDALDECGTPGARKSFMRILQHGLPKLPHNYRFIITSREEKDIVRTFLPRPDYARALELEYTSDISRRDVRAYLDYELRRIIVDEEIELEEGMFEQILTILGNAAGGLFVYASNSIKLISDHDNPQRRLEELISNPDSLADLDALYVKVLPILGISWNNSLSKEHFTCIIFLVLMSSTLDCILYLPLGNCHYTLSQLVDYGNGEPIRLFHTSFPDYLISFGSFEGIPVRIQTRWKLIYVRCSGITKDELRYNTGGLKASYNITCRMIERVSIKLNSTSTSSRSPYELALFQDMAIFLHPNSVSV